ncbi:MAG: extracellular solute-binding protein [Ruminococcus sp.]|nr:extracellular solute-binding protein [Ruminococcus sp.]
MKTTTIRKAAALTMAALMAGTALAGCGGNNGASKADGTADSASKAASGAKGSVYWLNFKPEIDETLQDLAKKYTKAKGVDVKVVTAASGTYSTTLTAEMDKSNPPTLFVIGNQQGVKDWGDFALDLKGTAIEKELNTDAYNLYDANGKLVSIGYCYECYGIIANPTLIEQAGHTMD